MTKQNQTDIFQPLALDRDHIILGSSQECNKEYSTANNSHFLKTFAGF